MDYNRRGEDILVCLDVYKVSPGSNGLPSPKQEIREKASAISLLYMEISRTKNMRSEKGSLRN